jgi:hypothetical protein
MAGGDVFGMPGATAATVVGFASSARKPHSVSHEAMSALTTAPAGPFSWWQQGIVQSVSAAYNGRTKRAPKMATTPKPASTRRVPGVFVCIGSRIVTLGDNVELRFIPLRAKGHCDV